ncbi:MAG: DNRLRE domain-containing protein, partial [Lachnospiraceae bacterium]|nr:DNRLRE domain-containing protein [Lachnospiraceae bacterium]
MKTKKPITHKDRKRFSLTKLASLLLCLVMLFNLLQPAAHAEGAPRENFAALEREMEDLTAEWEPEAYAGGDDGFSESSHFSEAAELDLAAHYDEVFKQSVSEISDDAILYEETERREESVKHFRLGDGTMAALQYAYPIHEKDEAGHWLEIDNRLVLTKDEKGGEIFALKRQSFSAAFYPEGQGDLLYRISLKEGSLGWGLLTPDPADSRRDAGVKAVYTPLTEEKNASRLDSKSISGLLEYKGILPGIRLSYQLAGYDIKENLILESAETVKQNGAAYTFVLETDGLIARQADDKSIEILDQAGNPRALIRAPYMMDAAGALSSGLRLEIQESGSLDQPALIKLTADKDWLLADKRIYPVTIDPTLTVTYGDYGSVETSTVYSAGPNATERYNISVGRNYGQENLRAVVKLTELPTLTEADTVIGASLSYVAWFYRAYASNHSGPVRINLHGLTEAVDIDTVTWNSLQGKYSSLVTDTQLIQPGEVNQNTGLAYRLNWDVTRLVKEWYLSGNNYGFAMISENEAPSSIRFVMLYSSIGNSAPANCRPTFILTYLNQEGLEPYLTANSAGSATMGTISVGDFNGNLVYTYNDLSMDGAYLPASLFHVYNHSKRNTAAVVGNGAYYGKGMQLNLSLRIQSHDSTDYPYRLMDGDGTLHYFKLKSGTVGATGSVYEKEFESTTLLTKTGSGFTLDTG